MSEQAQKIFESMRPEERAARWVLWRVCGVGFKRLSRLVQRVDGDLAGLFRMGEAARLDALAGARIDGQVGERAAHALASGCPQQSYAREVAALPAATRLLALGDACYPAALRDLESPPVFIYARGSFVGDDGPWRRVAVVGSRKVRLDGLKVARELAGGLARQGVVVVSGGALGVDAAAHEGCMDAGAPTLVVLAGGVDRPSPRRNAAIFERALAQGVLLSEYPLGVKPRSYHFQRRNELIAALGQATVVVRAGLKSGTMLTARAAAALGRPLCAVPGALDDPLAAGCNQLLVDGAFCARNAEDVLARVFKTPRPGAQLGLSLANRAPSGPAKPPPPAALDLSRFSEDARAIFAAFEQLGEAKSQGIERDTIKRRMDWPESRLSPAILELELGGAIIKKAGANSYRPA